VSEHFLDVAQVGSGLEHFTGQRVPEGVGADFLFQLRQGRGGRGQSSILDKN